MKRVVFLTLGLFVWVLAMASMATADVPNQMNYQGQLTDDLGAPLDTALLMTFTIYDDSTGGGIWWTETQMVVIVNGLFAVQLGAINSIPDTVMGVPADPHRYLGIQVASDPEIEPRTRLVSVPYALRVASVDGAAGGTVFGDVAIQSDLDVDGDLRVTGKATIGSGHINTGGNAFVAGVNNSAVSPSATVGGGSGNRADGFASTVGGGQLDTASANYATVAGGYSNTASGEQATVSGGALNVAGGPYSAVGGGENNTASGDNATVGGGANNSATGSATVGGGDSNIASGLYSTISGGLSDTASGEFNTVGGGHDNTTGGHGATIGGGWENRADSDGATIGGGSNNNVSGGWATIGGGNNNTASGWSGTVGGGDENRADTHFTTVGGGRLNTADGEKSTVGGGWGNTASQWGSTVGGGEDNWASAGASTVSGGYSNTASEHHSTVGGGNNNIASGIVSTVGGGEGNTASGDYSAVSGGRNNSNAGDNSAIPGGREDTLTSAADYSMAFGYGVYVDHAYRVVLFDSVNSGRLGINRDDHTDGINHPIHVGTDISNGNGAYLTSGGAWMGGSSRTFKENFQPIDSQDLLARISGLPVEAWQYKDSEERHIGPVSEDFVQAFDVGTVRSDGNRDNQYLSPGDVAGVALAGVKELIQENQKLAQIINDLTERIAELEETKTSR